MKTFFSNHDRAVETTILLELFEYQNLMPNNIPISLHILKLILLYFLWRLAFRYYENLYSVILSLKIKVKRQYSLSLSLVTEATRRLAEISSLNLHFYGRCG